MPSPQQDSWVRAMKALARETEDGNYDPKREPLMLAAMRAQYEAAVRQDRLTESNATNDVEVADFIIGIVVGVILTSVVWLVVSTAGFMVLFFIIAFSFLAAVALSLADPNNSDQR